MLTDDLLALQDLDLTLDRLAHRRSRLDERVTLAAAGERLAASSKRLSEIEARISELATAVEEAEAASQEISAGRQRLEQQLRTVIAPREAEALTAEIATLTARRDELDDAELGHLEEQSLLDTERSEALAALPTLEAEVEAATSALATAEAAIEREAADASERREALVASIDDAVLADYTSRRDHFGGVAVSRLEGARCGGCHLDLSTGERERVRATAAGDLTDCPQCGRLLVP